MTKYPIIEEEHLHGEVVGFGVLIALLVDGNIEAFKRIKAFNESVGLPVKVSQIGVSDAEFKALFEEIPEMSDLNHYPYKVTQKMLEDAVAAL